MHEWHSTKPASASGYLEAMTRVILTAGISWQVVDAKWDGIREALGGFDVEKVADMTPDDVDRLAADARMIRNRRKIEAIIRNAATISDLSATFGGFDKYLRSQGSYEETAAALKRDFSFMGDSTIYFFLAMVGEAVPDWEEHEKQHPGRQGPAKPGARSS